jgi:putative salt-induced outer membrane protein YdiY
MRWSFAFVVPIVLGAVVRVDADQVTFMNGDRLTGTLIEGSATGVRLRTDAMGVVTMPWAAIAELSAGPGLEVVLADNRTVRGELQVAKGAATVKTESGDMAVRVEDIRVIHGRALDTGAQPDTRAEPPPPWGGDADAGLSLTRGNADTMTVDLSSHVTRQSDRDRLALYLASLFSNTNTTIGRAVTTARSVRGGGRYDHDLVGDAFAFGLADLESDKFQLLNLREVIGTGLGWHAKKTDEAQLNFFAGLSYSREDFSIRHGTGSLIRTGVEAMLGEDAFAPVGDGGNFTEQVAVYLSRSGGRRFAADASLTLPLKGALNFRLSLSDRYLSNPLPGVQKNDLLLTSGLSLTFGRENPGSYEGGSRPGSSGPSDTPGTKQAPKRAPKSAPKKH